MRRLDSQMTIDWTGAMGGATSFKPCMLISSPSLPPPPLPYPPSPTPSFPPFPSRPGWRGPNLTYPSPPFPSPPFSPSPGSHPLNQLGAWGSAVSFPVWSGAMPQPTNDLVHIWAKRSSSGGNSFCAFY